MKCNLPPNLYMALHSLVSEAEKEGRRYSKEITLEPAISLICGHSDCYCDKCVEIAREYYDVSLSTGVVYKKPNQQTLGSEK